jgi:hypothetical protein
VLCVLAIGLVVACGGDNGGPTPDPNALKIFVTATGHVADFTNDPTLQGNNGVEKADDFCNKASNKPDRTIYKALLLDNALRVPTSGPAWVLQANRTYHRANGVTAIGTTGPDAFFQLPYVQLANAIDPTNKNPGVWTGVVLPNWNAGENCNGWSALRLSGARIGYSDQTGEQAVDANTIMDCSCLCPVYCVQQP